MSLLFAIPDHPWVDIEDGAAVRIAMTVGEQGQHEGVLQKVILETSTKEDLPELIFSHRIGEIAPDLRIGPRLTTVTPLKANSAISGMGVALHGSGFVLSPADAQHYRRSGAAVIKPYIGGIDLLRTRRERYLIDFSFMDKVEALSANPAAFQHVLNYVKPERDMNRREAISRLWWRFGWERPDIRRALKGLDQYIAKTETAKHRVFQFLENDILPDHTIVVFATDDATWLGILSSRVHVTWALAAGGRLGVGNDPRYNKTRCFDPFPFPACNEALTARIRTLGEELDAFRKARQAEHPELTMTGMYNVLEKLKAGVALSEAEREVHGKGLVSVLLDIHRRLDALVIEAYGWPAEIGDEQILERLVALNRERAEEERRGLVRWLRPEYQAPRAKVPEAVQEEMAIAAAPAGKVEVKAWPKALPDQVRAITTLLATGTPITVKLAARSFRGAKAAQVGDVLQALVALGQARALPGERFAA